MFFKQKDTLHKVTDHPPNKTKTAFEKMCMLNNVGRAWKYAFSFAAIKLMLFCAPSALFAQAPPAKFYVDGWNAYAEFNVPKEQLKYSFILKNDVSSGGYVYYNSYGDSLDTDGIDIKDSSLLSQKVFFPLIPDTMNRIILKVEKVDDKGDSQEIYSIDTLFKPKSIVISSDNASVFFEDEKYADNSKKALDIYDKYCAYSQEKKQKIFLYGQEDMWTGHWSFNDYDSCIYGVQEAPDDSIRVLLVMFHEKAHAYFYGIVAGSYNDDVGLYQLYEQMNKIIYSSDIVVFYVSKPPPEEVRQHPLAKLFTESAYSKSSHGHPWSDHEELFASTSTILCFFPKEFFERLAGLEETNPEYAKLAKEIARKVVSCYGNNRIFPNEIYEKLNIE